MNQTAIGSAATCREQMEAFIRTCELDGLMLTFADYAQGIAVVGQGILPGLRRAFA